MATLVCLLTLWFTSLFAAIHHFLVFKVAGDIFFYYLQQQWDVKKTQMMMNKKFINVSAKGTTLDAIAQKIVCHVDTVKRFQKDPWPRKKRPDAGILKTVTERDLRNIGRQLRMRPGLSSKSVDNRSWPSWRTEILKECDPSDHRFCVSSTELDGPDGWANGWVYFGDERHRRLRRQQQDGGVMIWAGIIEDRLVGPIKVREGVKVTSASYCNLLNESLVPWLDDIPLSLLRDFSFMQDNTPLPFCPSHPIIPSHFGHLRWKVDDLAAIFPRLEPDWNFLGYQQTRHLWRWTPIFIERSLVASY